MWHLQRPKFNQKHNALLKLLLGSTIFHVSICVLLFFVYSDSQKLQFEVSNVPRDIIVQLATVSTPQKFSLKTSIKAPVKRTASSVKTSLKTGIIKKAAITKKIVTKVKEPVKKVEPVKPELKQEQIKEVKAEPVKPFVQDTPQVIKVTQQELNQLELEQLVQESISTVWAPPAGMDKELVCKASLTIDWNGTITETVLTEPSNVLVYDIAVEQTVAQLKLPRQLWGKTITLVFKP